MRGDEWSYKVREGHMQKFLVGFKFEPYWEKETAARRALRTH